MTAPPKDSCRVGSRFRDLLVELRRFATFLESSLLEEGVAGLSVGDEVADMLGNEWDLHLAPGMEVCALMSSRSILMQRTYRVFVSARTPSYA